MSLLPRSHQQFQLKQYWDKFFTRRDSPFEWYGEYTDLCHVIHRYVKPGNKILVVGCGNSKLSEQLYDVGYQSIDNIDISEIVIRQMALRNRQKRPKMTFAAMDVQRMDYGDSAYDCVIDKGTLDALLTDEEHATLEKVDKMFSEIARVLKVAGRYLLVTLAQAHILEKLLRAFESGWLVRVHHVTVESPLTTGRKLGASLPVFAFVMTKMMTSCSLPTMKVYEYANNGDSFTRCASVDGIREYVTSLQQYSMVKYHLAKHPIESPVYVDLWSDDESLGPRYTLHVVDLPAQLGSNGMFAIFIVPQGRQLEWLFSTEDGRRQLAQSAGYQRLVVVTLHRDHRYGGVEEVKEEIASRALELAQDGLPQLKKYPVLTLGDDLGSHTIVHRGTSPISGPYVVEEFTGEEGAQVRRLVFLRNPLLAQTEVQMKREKNKTNKKRSDSSSLIPDLHFLFFDYHKTIVASLSLIQDLCSSEHDIMIIGLGGGALPSYIHQVLPKVKVTVVELDPVMVRCAEEWFGLEQCEEMKVVVGDGVEYMKNTLLQGKKGHFHVIIFDVDSKDLTLGMSCPSPAFVEEGLLMVARELLSSQGALITNLVSRNLEMKNAVLKRLCDMFPQVIGIPVPSDVNEVMVAMVMPREDISQLASPDSPLKLLSSPAVKASFQSLVDTISGVDGGRSPVMRDHWETSLNHAVLL